MTVDPCLEAAIHHVYAQREEILEAFIAKYGFEPERTIQCLQIMPDGTIQWFVKRMTDEEMKEKSLTCSGL